MFSVDNMIDAVQKSQKNIINTFITEKSLKDNFNTLIDKQTDVIKHGFDTYWALFDTVNKK